VRRPQPRRAASPRGQPDLRPPAPARSLRRPSGARALVASFSAAAGGLAVAWRRGRNFRIQVALGYGAVVLSSWLRLPAGEVAAIAVAAGLVLAAETLNTAVEALVDLVTREYHPLARTAKDLAAGAVLLTAVAALVVALLALLPHAPAVPAALRAAWRLSPGRVVLAAAVQVLLLGAAARFRGPGG
jgi:diacylglycerol kinase (ATP)